MQFTDSLVLDAPRMTSDGYMAVRARAARTGIYDYAASEMPGAPDRFKAGDTVRVYRSESEVFSRDSVGSFISRPITNDHPAEQVNASNWRDYTRGHIAQALRDGEFLAFDLVVMDASAIGAVKAGKRELSLGYTCQIDWTPGVTADGAQYDARQTNIRGNHIAVVDAGRAGPKCAILIDGFANCEANPAAVADFEKETPAMADTTIVVDGLPVSLADQSAVRAVIAKKDAAIAASDKALADATAAHDRAMAAKDAEIDDLKTKVIDQSKIDALADAKAAVVTDAKSIAGAKLGDTNGKSVAEVRRMAVAAKLGDAAVTDKSDDYVECRFDTLKDSAAGEVSPASGVANIAPAKVIDATAALETARNAYLADKFNAHRAA